MKVYILFLIIFTSSVLRSEEVKNNSIQQAISPKKIILKDVIQEHNFISFSILNNCQLIIIEDNNNYKELFLKNDSILFIKKINKTPILEKLFNKDMYKSSSSKSQFEKTLSNGNDTHFYYMDRAGKKHGEFFSVTLIYPPPIDPELYYFLLNRLLRNNEINTINTDN